MPDRPSRSLARTLLLVLVGAVAATWLATAVISYLDARHELGELLDAHLAQVASLLLAGAGDEVREVDDEHAPHVHRYGRRVAFQIWANGTSLRLHSANAPDARMSERDEGFSDVVLDGRRWRVFSAWDDGRRHLVQVGERLDARDGIVVTIARNLLAPIVVALPVLALAIGIGIRRALRPLTLLGRQIEARAPGNLAAVEVSKAPTEVAPLVDGLNRLLARVRDSIESERRFTADAAHELRTPLAALRGQAQVARGASTEGERRVALDRVIEGCDRASHLVDQLLTLARLEPQGFRAELRAVDLRPVLREVAAQVAPFAIGKGTEIELDDGAPVAVLGDAHLLAVMFRNLVDNAVRYGPAGSRVRVSVRRSEGGAIAVVEDEGPGVPAEERERLGRRFHRLGASGATGTGLGLSIVRRIAELHGATLAFGSGAGGRGLAVEVRLPPA